VSFFKKYYIIMY